MAQVLGTDNNYIYSHRQALQTQRFVSNSRNIILVVLDDTTFIKARLQLLKKGENSV